MFKRKGVLLTFILLFALSLSACGANKPEEKAYNYLEKAAANEEDFNKAQEPLVKEEQKEQDLYEKIMKLNTSKRDQIVEYSDQALKSIDKRKKLIDQEKKSIDDAYHTFKKALSPLKEAGKNKGQSHVNALIQAMEDRFHAYESLYKAYGDSITNDQKLFNLLKEKDISIESLQQQLDKVNGSYKKIDTLKATFNQYTKTFNREKKAFYKAYGLSGGK
ncbi:YkyA family protein [Camelliibacillus cellulosilyticus]|uniref:YkyA family protein n=1 Tax=Camelliibacillus cellulosilyticus TaxID=2174486 RepID=A0ABV9GFU2_9BACL